MTVFVKNTDIWICHSMRGGDGCSVSFLWTAGNVDEEELQLDHEQSIWHN